jgi:Protein of unknown function (DUF2778)
MWTYRQSDGVLQHDGVYVATGYSGFEDGKNNPAMQDHMGLGPIPCGSYTIQVIVDGDGQAVDYEGKKAPVMRLVPDAGNQMFGRSGFLIHGDSISAPGTASHGCVIEGHDIRETIAQNAEDGDNQLQVVSGEPLAASA